MRESPPLLTVAARGARDWVVPDRRPTRSSPIPPEEFDIFDDMAPEPVPLLPEHGPDELTTEIYMLALRHPQITRAQLVTSGITTEYLDRAVELLVEQGLLRSVGDETWQADPPEQTLPALAIAYETRSQYLRTIAGSLGYLYHAARQPRGDDSHGVRVLDNTEHLRTAVFTALGTATAEVWAAHDDSPSSAHLFRSGLEVHRERLLSRTGTPLRRRTVFDSAMMQFDRAGDVLMARAEAGEEHRFLTGVPFTVVVADESLAVVDLTAFDTSGAGSLLVTDRRLVLALRRLCETWWNFGTPMAWASIGDIDRDSAFILSMLAAGATDATMAAQSGVSHRTIERRVRTLMARLGAATRFQAGVLAARRGWI